MRKNTAVHSRAKSVGQLKKKYRKILKCQVKKHAAKPPKSLFTGTCTEWVHVYPQWSWGICAVPPIPPATAHRSQKQRRTQDNTISHADLKHSTAVPISRETTLTRNWRRAAVKSAEVHTFLNTCKILDAPTEEGAACLRVWQLLLMYLRSPNVTNRHQASEESVRQ